MSIKKKIKITLTEDILGSLPADPEVYKTYIGSKSANASKIEEEVAALGVDEVFDNKMTIFAKTPNGEPFIFDYVIKGFFKNACSAMREADGAASKDLKAYKKKIDNLVFAGPRKIMLRPPEGEETAIDICERPLRASTAQGERVALAASEQIKAGTTLTFFVEMLNSGMWKFVQEWLDYGKYNGLGQWHNSGKGRFTWEELPM